MMSSQSDLVRRFLSALDQLSNGPPLRRLKNANDVARDVALPQEQLGQILAEAVEAGLLERHPDNLAMVRLTEAGIAFARGKKQQ